ncbi:MAG: Cys-tRNA(Pro) deacylase [Veillonella sp.]|uniref:Cys-tRNA(Pro) deacylase n=1 Tax=Veillonella sp. TaxID=1926307 RepID=UPI0025EC0140|nr:Cys-tRNA(Pro) deacylase [Veillonella sp.]MBS4913733.1 Cys-tRNA(Pro) deacylase [Veillonella sp.]
MSKKDHKKTNAMRMLDTHKVDYEVLTYEVETQGQVAQVGRNAGLHVAEEMHLPEEQVFKTLVGKGNVTGPVVFCIPVAEELDLKQAARVSGNKSVELIHVKDLLGLTGYVRGGCSPIGMKKLFPTYFDNTMEQFDHVYVSAGMIGKQVKVNPQDLQSVVQAKFEPLTMGARDAGKE